MEDELKSYFLQIIKNQARIISQLSRIQETLQPEKVESEEIENKIKEIYEQISNSKFKVNLAERELFEAKIKNGEY